MSRLVIPKLGFLLHIPNAFFSYRPVFERLPIGSFDIVLPDDPPPELLELILSQDYRYTLISDLISAKTMYKYLVSDQLFLQDYQLMHELGSRQIRFFSELGNDRLNLGNTNRFYDLFLCWGRYQQNKLSFCAPTPFFQVGWPHMDAWHEGMNVNVDLLLDSLNCDRYRPVLVWQPTFGDLSSIDAYAETLSLLTSRYNIVVKPHDYTLLEEPERVAFLKAQKFQTVLTEPFDELLLYVAADYVLADYGNTPFGAIYTDQRLILLDLPDASYHPFTGMGSSEITLRNYYPSVDPGDNPDVFIRLIEEDSEWQTTARQNRLRDRFFTPSLYGRSAKQAADVLNHLEQFI